MFGKKKQQEREKPVMTAVEVADKIGQQAGLLPDEMLKLLDSLERVEKNRKIIPQKAVQEKIVSDKPVKLPKAVEIARERLEEHKKREELRRTASRKKHLKFFESESHDVIEDGEYPRKLSPYDIGKSSQIASQRLREEEKAKEPEDPAYRRAELILHSLDRTKVTEAARVARTIAARQERIGRLSLEEAERLAKLPPEKRYEINPEIEEQLEIARSLHGFKKHANTVIDEAAEVVQENVDAAASVVKQWIGMIHEEK